MVRSTKPSAVMPTPIHWRLPSEQPKKRSARTVRKTRPPERTAWTIDSGARERAPTWKHQATTATPQPMANHFDRNSSPAERTG